MHRCVVCVHRDEPALPIFKYCTAVYLVHRVVSSNAFPLILAATLEDRNAAGVGEIGEEKRVRVEGRK